MKWSLPRESVVVQAISSRQWKKGEFDLYPEYTSSGWIMVLGHEAGEVSDEENVKQSFRKSMKKEFDMTWIGLYGFNNTYAVVTTKEAADQYQLETCSDLAKVSDQLVFGVIRIILNVQTDSRDFQSVWFEF